MLTPHLYRLPMNFDITVGDATIQSPRLDADDSVVAVIRDDPDGIYTIRLKHYQKEVVELHCNCPDWQPAPLNPASCRHIRLFKQALLLERYARGDYSTIPELDVF